ncbi:poly(ethylene terephthalate) hydrolase family protein [Actinoallomurus rhizosphaericola]|uniref:poly(ethylene terephthalate) hydrolase family protein n=1 Tax=Actinoallomurus rhizosphaericola TaxID=2952536 RepID=UPI002091681B|nr:cellulose binding domain-containing protein [Actinoallomurus rhizosphaericola]MCO5994345.1 cellulose binding domain-containing protein [Actinoallomurus rhizosphaericola]
MAEQTPPPQAPEGAPARRIRSGSPARPLRLAVAAIAALAAMIALTVATWPASAAGNPYQRGPDPTLASVAASRGTFATAQVSVPAGNGFNGGTIYYPTDSSQGTWGAVAIVPGYTALFANEEAWMGPWLASFGFVVIGIETNSRTDFDTARGTQLLAALDYLTQKSPVRDRVDSARLGVIGHSMGGGGVVYATEHRPSLKAAVALAPFSPSQDMSTDHVPTMVMGGQNDTVVTPSYLDGLYATMPASTQSDFVQLAGADHVAYTHPNTTEMRLLIPWLKIFLDDDTRYTQFLCPLMDSTGVSAYHSKCPYVPPGGSTSTPTPTPTITPTPPPSGACSATYRTVNSWSGGYQGEVTVTAGDAAINGWTVRWNLGGGQTVTQVWNGTLSTSGSTATVTNASYNGSLQASASTTFGFLANGTPSTPAITCTSP